VRTIKGRISFFLQPDRRCRHSNGKKLVAEGENKLIVQAFGISLWQALVT